MRYRNPLPLVLRAALGGAIDGLIILTISVVQYKVTLGYVPYWPLFIYPGLPLALGVGTLIGVLVGISIWAATVITGRTFGMAVRAIIGVVSARVILSIYAFFHTEPAGYYQPIYTWTEQALLWVLTGVVFGLLPGILARYKLRHRA